MTPMQILLFTILSYIILGAAGLYLAIPTGYASPIFPAAGLAIALVLVFERWVFLGIFIGSFLLNILASLGNGAFDGKSIAIACIIALSSTIQTYVAKRLVNKFAKNSWEYLANEKEVFLFLLVAGPLSCLTAATISTISLALLGAVHLDDIFFFWCNWWIGDSIGVLVFTPLVLIVLKHKYSPWAERKFSIVIPMVLLLALIAFIFISVAKQDNYRQKKVIDGIAENITRKIERRLVAHHEALAALRRLIEVNPKMSFQQFEYYTRSTVADNKDIFALSYNSFVLSKDRSNFEKEMKMIKNSPFANFKITEKDASKKIVQAMERKHYVAVKYISPLEKNIPALGFDINSEPIRSAAISRAINSKRPSVTDSIILVQENKERPGILVLHPAYKLDLVNKTEKKNELLGFAVGVFVIEEMILLAINDVLPTGIVLQVSEQNVVSDKSGNHEYRQIFSSLPVESARALLENSNYEWTEDIRVIDRNWKIEIISTVDYFNNNRSLTSLIIGITGLVLAALLQIIMLAMTGRSFSINKTVNEQTKKLKDQGSALQSAVDEHLRLISRIPVGVFKLRKLSNHQKRFEYVSDLFCQQLGVSSIVLMKNAGVLLSIIHHEDVQSFYKKLQETESSNLNFVWAGRIVVDNSIRWIEISAAPTQLDNGDWMWDGIQLDVTESRRSIETQKLLDTAVKQSYASVIITDGTGKIVFVNDAFIKLTGYQKEEVIGKNPRIFKSGLTKHETYVDLWTTITKKNTWKGELYNKKKSGELYWEMATISPVINERDVITHYIGIKENISERKNTEIELQKAKSSAEMANLAKSDFLAKMSHEIRTPMNSILGITELLEETSLNEEQKKYVKIFKSAGENLLIIINDILDLSKFETSKTVLEKRIFFLDELIKDVVDLLEIKTQERNNAIQTSVGNLLGKSFIGDPYRIKQILINLIGNANKFTHKGYIAINVSLNDLPSSNEARIVFKITDTGIGVPKEKLEQLFRPFSQADESITRKFGGTGLGLVICQKLIEMMNGEIVLTSTEGVGSCVTFSIVLEKNLSIASVNEKQIENISNTENYNNAAGSDKNKILDNVSLNILFVDDVSENRMIFKAFLKKTNHNIFEAVNGEEAIELVKNNKFDLIFMDAQMPGMDGLTATRAIREWEKQFNKAPTTIYALTAHALKEEQEKSILAGHDAHLIKPIKKDVLLNIINEYILKTFSTL